MRLKNIFFLFQCALSSLLIAQEESALDSTKKSSGLAYFPIVFYTPETNLAFGAGIFHVSRSIEEKYPSSFSATLIYTLNKQIVGEVSTNMFFDSGNIWHLGNFFYQQFPNTFYGIGNETPDSAKEKFSNEVVRLNPSLLFRVSERMFAGPLINFETWRMRNLEAGKMLSQGTIPGSRTTTVLGIGGVVNYDERDNLFASTSGRFYQAEFIASPKFFKSSFPFTRLKIDAREYFALNPENIISVQGLFHTATGTVPFRFLPKLGGQNILRGYFEGRYRDNHMIVVQTEYRSPFWYRFGFAVFAGIGEVANRFIQFSIQGIKPSYGAGIRFAFIPEERIILRVDYGRGINSDGVYITLNEAI